MIVDPDFLDHWRTRMLVDALGGDEMVPMCLIRLWAHCQVRRGDRFEMPAAGLKAQCRYTGNAQAFEDALIEAKFIERDGDWIHVLGWAEQNASLLAAWENGGKGGRPKKEPTQNPRVTQGKPTGNPTGTQGEPNENPDVTDKSREEKSREEKDKEPSSLRSDERRSAPRVSDEVPASVLIDAGMTEKTAADFIAHKRRKKAPLTSRAWADHERESVKAGWSVHDAAEKVMAKGWKGFEASYVERDAIPHRAHAPPAESFRERDQRLAKERYEEAVGIRRPIRTEAEVIDVTPRRLGR